MHQLIAFRFFAGCFGVCPVTLGGASISDLIPQEKRGASMSLFGMGPLMGLCPLMLVSWIIADWFAGPVIGTFF